MNAYIDCSEGISGDMLLSALINTGLNPNKFQTDLKKKLKVKDWYLEVKKIEINSIPAIKIKVLGNQKFSNWSEIKSIILKSGFSEKTKKLCLTAYKNLFDAESYVHKTKKIHLHQCSDIDTLIDITGSIYGIEILGIDKIYCSKIKLGITNPAVLRILQSINAPVYFSGENYETVTPTAASIISSVVDYFGESDLCIIKKFGFGAGNNSNSLLRIYINQDTTNLNNVYQEKLFILETNIDDLDPRIYPYVMERLLKSGANDVWLNQIIMKKGRPGILLSVLAKKEKMKEIMNIIFNETTTLGIRVTEADRFFLKRFKKNNYKYIISTNGRIKKRIEFEKVKLASKKIPLKDLIL